MKEEGIVAKGTDDNRNPHRYLASLKVCAHVLFNQAFSHFSTWKSSTY